MSQDADQSPQADMPDPAQVACLASCQALAACGAHKPESTCDALCAQLAGKVPHYGGDAACQACLSRGCQAAASCLRDAAGPCGQPNAQLTALLQGVEPGRVARGALRLWDGSAPVAQATGQVLPQGNAQLGFGEGAAHVGVRYLIDYFVDMNDDGVCEPGVDVLGQGQTMLDSLAIFGFQPLPHSPSQDAALCQSFPSLATLCQTRCDAAAACGDEEASPECAQTCQQDSVERTSLCVQCLEGKTCEQRQAQCRQAGQVCRRDFVPPDATLIAVGVDVYPEQDAGKTARAIVRNASGRRVVPERETQVTAMGRVVFNFGMSVWRGQDYSIELYQDADDDGRCSAGEQAWRVPATIEANIITVIRNFDLTVVSPLSCADYDTP